MGSSSPLGLHMFVTKPSCVHVRVFACAYMSVSVCMCMSVHVSLCVNVCVCVGGFHVEGRLWV